MEILKVDNEMMGIQGPFNQAIHKDAWKDWLTDETEVLAMVRSGGVEMELRRNTDTYYHYLTICDEGGDIQHAFLLNSQDVHS